METWRSGGASGGGGRVAVFDEIGWSEGSAINWKSAMRRSAHLLAEQVVERLAPPPPPEEEGMSLWDFRRSGRGTRRRGVVRRPKPMGLKASIEAGESVPSFKPSFPFFAVPEPAGSRVIQRIRNMEFLFFYTFNFKSN